MRPDIRTLYALMYKSRLYEEGITHLWEQGHISGEMHLGTGEEAIMAGIISQLQPGDALALNHRGTSPLLMVGVDPRSIIRELLGRTDCAAVKAIICTCFQGSILLQVLVSWVLRVPLQLASH